MCFNRIWDLISIGGWGPRCDGEINMAVVVVQGWGLGLAEPVGLDI